MARTASAPKQRKPRASKPPALKVISNDAHDDVQELDEEDLRVASYHQLVDVCRRDNAKLDEMMSAVAAFKKGRNKNRNTIKNAGYPLHLVDRILKEEGMSRRDLQAEQDLEAWMREQHGLPIARTGQQLELELKATETDRDLAYYAQDGYAAGVQGRECKPPAGMHPSFMQTWQAEWNKGQQTLIWSKSVKVNPERLSTGTAASRPDISDEPEDEQTDLEDSDPSAMFDEDDSNEVDFDEHPIH